MAKLSLLSPSRSIKLKLLLMMLGISTITIVVIAAIAVNSAQNQGQAVQEISGQALRTQAEHYLMQLNLASARENDLVMERVSRDTQKVADYIASIYAQASYLEAGSYWPYEKHIHVLKEGQYANPKGDSSSVFIPNSTEITERVIREVELSAYLDFIFDSIFQGNPNVQAIYFATPQDVVRYYPNIDLGAVLPPDFRATQRIWYTGSTQQGNQEGKAWWTPVYVDATGLGLVTTAAYPVYSPSEELLGVIGMDISLAEMKESIETNQPLQGGYTFLIENSGKAIALPSQGFKHILGRESQPDEVAPDLTETPTGFSSVIEKMMAGESGLASMTVDEEELYVAYAPLASTGWSLGSVVKAAGVLQLVSDMRGEVENTTRFLVFGRIFPTSILIFIVVITIGLVMVNRLINPLPRLAEAAQKIGSGQWEVKLPPTGKDEIGSLAQSLKSMSVQLRGLILSLEQHVAERTQELERRAMQVRTAAQVAKDAAAIRDLKPLLDQTTQLVSSRFGYYHAGIFLVDEAGEYVILHATNSEGGKRLLEKGHKLRIGKTGIVGHVASTGDPRIAMNVGSDAAFFDNPELPQTRSEMALPMKIHGRVIGVLDVQSTAVDAFTEEDAQTLQILADQIALAIENARLFAENQQAFKELEAQYAKSAQMIWTLRLGRQPMAWVYNRLGVEPATSSEINELEMSQPVTGGEADQRDHRMGVPIKVHNQVIGTITLQRDSEQEAWSREDQLLIEKAVIEISQALEFARLMEENQLRAERERLIGQIASRTQSSLHLETIMKTAVKEIGLATDATKVQISLTLGKPKIQANGNGNG